MCFFFFAESLFDFALWINNTPWIFFKEQVPLVHQTHFIYHFSATHEWWVIHVGIEGLGSLVWAPKAGCSSAVRFDPDNKHSFWVLAKTLYCLYLLQKSQPCLGVPTVDSHCWELSLAIIFEESLLQQILVMDSLCL